MYTHYSYYVLNMLYYFLRYSLWLLSPYKVGPAGCGRARRLLRAQALPGSRAQGGSEHMIYYSLLYDIIYAYIYIYIYTHVFVVYIILAQGEANILYYVLQYDVR